MCLEILLLVFYDISTSQNFIPNLILGNLKSYEHVTAQTDPSFVIRGKNVNLPLLYEISPLPKLWCPDDSFNSLVFKDVIIKLHS